MTQVRNPGRPPLPPDTLRQRAQSGTIESRGPPAAGRG